jgi:hypothetical protein
VGLIAWDWSRGLIAWTDRVDRPPGPLALPGDAEVLSARGSELTHSDQGVKITNKGDTMRLKLAIPFLLLAVLVIVVN